MANRMAFSRVAIGQAFTFLGNPIVWRKTTEFECVGESIPNSHWTGDFPVCSAINGQFSTLAIVDVQPDFDDCNPISYE